MEKVKITPKQAKEIEELSVDGYPFYISYHVKGKLAWEHLQELSLDEFIKALYIGYEVEPEFKKGDYVMVKWKNREKEEFYRVVSIDPWGSIQIETLDGVPNVSGHENTRHATPEEIAAEKERRWWKKHGRDVWELRKGDLLKDNHFGKITEVREVEDKHYLIDAITSYEPLDFIKRNYTVVCFAEQRLDREGEQ